MTYTANKEGSWGVRRSVKATLMGALAGALGAALLLPSLAHAGNISYTADTNVELANGLVLVILSGSAADTVSLNGSTLTVTNTGGDSLTLRSPTTHNRLINGSGLNDCTIVSGRIELVITNGTAVAVSPTTSSICSVTSGSGGGGGGGGGGGAASTTPSVSLSAPKAGATLNAGSTTSVSWTTAGSGISSIELNYSTDGGVTKKLIATNLDKSTAYSWSVPSTLSGTIMLLVDGYDSGKSKLASTSATMTVVTAASAQAQQQADQQAQVQSDADAGITRNSSNQRVAPASGTTGPSPATGATESISKVQPGWYVRGFSYPTIYYITSDMTRRPFWDGTSYFTWSDKWDNVVWVTDATLATLPLGAPMLPKPGAVLVKIQSDAKTYAVEYGAAGTTTYNLRWITSEAVAKGIYGNAWADYIIDLEPTTFSRYQKGADLATAEALDVSGIKTRMGLAGSVAGSN